MYIRSPTKMISRPFGERLLLGTVSGLPARLGNPSLRTPDYSQERAWQWIAPGTEWAPLSICSENERTARCQP